MAPNTYAVLGSTGNCGTALITNLLRSPGTLIHAYCRNRSKLLRLLPDIKEGGRVSIFEGSVLDIELLKSCVRDCRAIFLVVSTNDNIPNCRVAQDTANAVIKALQSLRAQEGAQQTMPRLVLLSSNTVDDYLSRHVPYLLRPILLRSASFVYRDLIETEKLLRGQQDWLTAIYAKPGMLSVDIQRGHELSFTDSDQGAVSYLDLAAAMIEAADDEQGRYDQKSVSVVNTNGKAKFPAGTPMCILTGLLRHFFPFLHPYLPTNTGPR
jgi:NAD(P)H-binding